MKKTGFKGLTLREDCPSIDEKAKEKSNNDGTVLKFEVFTVTHSFLREIKDMKLNIKRNCFM